MDKCSEHKDLQLRNCFLNRLSPEEVEDFQFHLFHCKTCQMNLERMRLLAYKKEDDFVSAFDTESLNVKKRRLNFSAIFRVAAVIGLFFVILGGCYYFMYKPSEVEFQLEVNDPPAFHLGDSVKMELDSVTVKSNEKKKNDVE